MLKFRDIICFAIVLMCIKYLRENRSSSWESSQHITVYSMGDNTRDTATVASVDETAKVVAQLANPDFDKKAATSVVDKTGFNAGAYSLDETILPTTVDIPGGRTETNSDKTGIYKATNGVSSSVDATVPVPGALEALPTAPDLWDGLVETDSEDKSDLTKASNGVSSSLDATVPEALEGVSTAPDRTNGVETDSEYKRDGTDTSPAEVHVAPEALEVPPVVDIPAGLSKRTNTLLVAVSDSSCNWSATEAMLQSVVDSSASADNFDIVLVHVSPSETSNQKKCAVPDDVKAMGIQTIGVTEATDATLGWNLAYSLFTSMGYEFLFLARTNLLLPPGAVGAMVKQLEDDPDVQVITPLTSPPTEVKSYGDVCQIQAAAGKGTAGDPSDSHAASDDVPLVFLGLSKRGGGEIELGKGVLFNAAHGSDASAFGLLSPPRGVRARKCSRAVVYPAQEGGALFPVVAQEAASATLPAVQPVPSPPHPFMFFHAEKTSGSTLRVQIENGAKTHDLKYVIPCKGGTHCVTFSLDKLAPKPNQPLYQVSVFAGHFDYSSVDILHGQTRRWGEGDEKQLSCFTMVREPVSRFISYYYDRVHHWFGAPLKQLSAAQVQWLFDGFVMPNRLTRPPTPRKAPFDTSKGLQDGLFSGTAPDNRWGPLKVIDSGPGNYFSGMFNGVNGKYKGHMLTENFPPSPWTPLDQALARQRMSECVVGVHERQEETSLMVRHWFPWIEVQDLHLRRGVGGTHEKPEELSPEVLNVIRANLLPDIQLYNFGVRRFERQLQEL